MARIIKVSGNGEDTTLDDAPKRKMCWKCARYNKPGAKFCAFCGVQFATDDDHYQTDGRTVSSYDDTAYLSAPPPKVRKNRHILGAIILVAVIVIGALVIFSIYANSHDAVYNYEQFSYEPQSDVTVKVVYVANIRNDKVDNAYCGNFVPVLYTGNTPHPASGDGIDYYKPFEKGNTWLWELTVTVTYKELSQGVHIEWVNKVDSRTFDIALDPSIKVHWKDN